MRAWCWCSWQANAVLVRPACVLVLRLQGRGTWRRAREQERGSERATDCCCCCYGCDIAVADEMRLARLALRCSGEVLAMAMAAAMLATAIARVMLPTARWGWCDLRKREMHGGNDADARSAGHLRLLLLLMLPGGTADVRLVCSQCSVGAGAVAVADAGAGAVLVIRWCCADA